MKFFQKFAEFLKGSPTITPQGLNMSSTEYTVKIGPDGKLIEPFDGAVLSPEGANFFDYNSEKGRRGMIQQGVIHWDAVHDEDLPWVYPAKEKEWDDCGCTGTIEKGCPGIDKCERIQEERCNRDGEVWEGGLCNSLECPYATPGDNFIWNDGGDLRVSQGDSLMEEEEEPWHPFEFTQPEPTWKPATDDKGNFIFQGTGEWKPIDWVLMVKAVDEFLGKIKEEGAIYDLQTAPYEEYESFTKTQDIPDWVPVSGLGRGIIDWGDAEGISWKGKDGARYSITETDHSSIVKPTSDGAFEKAGEGPEECQMTDPEQENHEMFWGTISQAKAEEAEETLDAQINRPEPEVYVNQDGSCRPYYLIEGDKRTASMGNQFTYCDGRYKNTDLEIHPSEEDRGIEKLDSEPYHGNTWAGVGLYGKRDSKHHSDDTETDESRQYELTSGGSTVYAKTNASYPSGIDETTVLSLPEPNVRTPEQVDAEVQEILHRLGLGEETVTRSCGDVFVDLNCERPKNLLDKEDQAKAGDRLITVRKPIPRKKAWSPELRQALAGRKSKTFIAQELVWMLFGEIGAGGSIDFMKTVDMVNIVLGIRPISIYM